MVGVVSAPDRTAGRGSAVRATPVARCAGALGLVLLQPVRLRAPESVAALLDLRPELGVLADYGQIVPGAAARRDSARHAQPSPVAPAPPSGRNADPGRDPGRRLADRSEPVPDGRRPGQRAAGRRRRSRRSMGRRRPRTWRRDSPRSAAALISSKVDPWLRGELPGRAQPPGRDDPDPAAPARGRPARSVPAGEPRWSARCGPTWAGRAATSRPGRPARRPCARRSDRVDPSPPARSERPATGLALVTSDGVARARRRPARRRPADDRRGPGSGSPGRPRSAPRLIVDG